MDKKYLVYENGFLEEVYGDLLFAIDHAETVCNNVYNTMIIVQDDDEEVIEYLYDMEL